MRLLDTSRPCMEMNQGGSVVAFVMTLPVLLIFLFAVLDLGRTVFLRIALDDAAHVACQVAAASPGECAQETLRRAAFEAVPALEAEGLALAITVDWEDRESVAYVHHVYNDVTGAFEALPAQTQRQRVRIGLTVEGRYITPLGFALAAAAGRNDDRFVYEAWSVGAADVALEGG